jgi:hypothetical protein
MEILMIGESDKRAEALRENPDDVILCEIIRYGCFNDSTIDKAARQAVSQRGPRGLLASNDHAT